MFYELKWVMNVIRDSQYPSGWFLIYTCGSIKKSPLISDISKKILCLCVVQLSLFVYHCRIEPRSFVTWICGAENAKVSSDQKTNAHTRRFFHIRLFFLKKKYKMSVIVVSGDLFIWLIAVNRFVFSWLLLCIRWNIPQFNAAMQLLSVMSNWLIFGTYLIVVSAALLRATLSLIENPQSIPNREYCRNCITNR